jgi:hypothetical protein
MKLFNRVKLSVMTITVVLILSTVTPFVTLAQSQQSATQPVNETPIYTDVAAQLGLPYNITLDDLKKSGYVDPIVSQANKWKAEGMNDTQIVNNFDKKGVIYNPKTGAWAFGHNPTPEEQKYIPNISPCNLSYGYNPLDLKSKTINSNIPYVTPLTSPPSNIDAGMWTNDYAFSGFNYYMETGDLPVDTTDHGTSLYYVTTHTGCGSGGCFEIGVYHYNKDPSNYQVYTYSQNDDTGGAKPVGITVNTQQLHRYTITPTGVYNSLQGYQYAAAFDGQVVRTIYMRSLSCELSQCMEVWNSPGYQYTNNDGVHCYFQSQTLYTPLGTTKPWDNNIADQPGTPRQDYSTHLNRVISSGSWTDEMWVHN